MIQLTTAACDLDLGTTGIPNKDFIGSTTDMDTGRTEYWSFVTTFDLLLNDLEDPLIDGGKDGVDQSAASLEDFAISSNSQTTPDQAISYFQRLCTNAPHSFLNEDHCQFSTNACSSVAETGDGEISLLVATFDAIYKVTGEGATNRNTQYLYRVSNLSQKEASGPPPCEPEASSRWIRLENEADCTDTSVSSNTKQVFTDLFSEVQDMNTAVKDVVFPVDGRSCAAGDEQAFDFKVVWEGDCWQNTHPDNYNVYDFTSWVNDHPGNTAQLNPIKKIAEDGLFSLEYPSSHDLSRWNTWKQMEFIGRYGDTVPLFSLPSGATLFAAIGEAFQQHTLSDERGPSVVCGSPFEVANTHEADRPFRTGFDFRTTSLAHLPPTGHESIVATWVEHAISSSDQLRQRVAWALSQVLCMAPSSLVLDRRIVEPHLAFYDIFVRHAFGNYFDILKEVTYSPLMGESLSFINGISTGFAWLHRGLLLSPDENYAREIMQLFSIGLIELELNGTPRRDSNGATMRSYSNDVISEYARVFTGFQRQSNRGNIEISGGNRIDPLRILMHWKDPMPKVRASCNCGIFLHVCVSLICQVFILL